jgi:hypothetical protein
MARIEDLWFAMLTGTEGSDSRVNLVISEGGTDRLNQLFGDTFQQDQEPGRANLYWLDVRSLGIDDTRLVDGSIRVGLLGDDAWQPEVLFLWGTTRAAPPSQFPGVVPLAIETEIGVELSTNDAGAVPSLPLRLVRTGSPTMTINRLLLVLQTEFGPRNDINFPFGSGSVGGSTRGEGPEAGTDDPIVLQIIAAGGGLVVNERFPETPQDDFSANEANLYSVLGAPFTRAALGSDSVRLSIGGGDQWRPLRLFLFGLDDRAGRPESIIPLVYLDGRSLIGEAAGGPPGWPLDYLSTETGEGSPQVVLPLLPVPSTVTPPAGELEVG